MAIFFIDVSVSFFLGAPAVGDVQRAQCCQGAADLRHTRVLRTLAVKVCSQLSSAFVSANQPPTAHVQSPTI